jgi:DNA-binding response OmpR family regulator
LLKIFFNLQIMLPFLNQQTTMENKILIADDSKIIVSLVKIILLKESAEFVVITAPDGNEAVRKAIEYLPDIILMDWFMPELNGLEAMAILRQNEKTKNIPVIMLTGSDSINEAFESGANDFIQKPFAKAELISRINSALVYVNQQKEIQKKNIEIELQHDKLKMQMEILVEQKKEHYSISSIAEEIQEASLPSDYNIEEALKQHFILNLPNESIRNNFYWITRKGDISYFCVAYFNKRGAIAALINLFGLASLNEIIYHSSITEFLKPSEILEKLKKKFEQISFLDNEDKCSFNIVLCALDTHTHNFQYAGVNIPVYIIKNKELSELKTNSCNYGLFKESITFKNYKIQLAPDDLIYLQTEGFNEYHSHLDEPNYISNEIVRVFSEIHEKPLEDQKQIIQKTFNNLKKELRQIDNIIVIGIKVSN